MVLRSVSDPVERIAQIMEVSPSEILQMPSKVVHAASAHLDLILGTETPLHPKTVSMDGKPYGFIPRWSDFSLGEWIDMETYSSDVWSNAHRIMALLYRPITERVGDAYEIERYSAKEEADLWLDCPASWFAGALLFFSNSRQTLLRSMRRSLTAVTDSLIVSARNGDGMTSSSPSPVRTSFEWMQSLSYRLRSYFSTSPIYKTFIK